MLEKIKNWFQEKYWDAADWWYYYQQERYDKRREKAWMYCYKELYKNATPSADFAKLLKNAPVNAEGKKVIDYMAYYLPTEQIEAIIEKSIKKYKLSDFDARGFRLGIILGASPTSHKED